MKPIFIYALLDPANRVVRYAGKTDFPDRRIQVHIREATKLPTHCGRWINRLLAIGQKPVMEILDVVPDDEANFWEREYIQNFRDRGFDLTNETSGGDGASCGRNNPMFGVKGAAHPAFGYRHTPEARQKISKSHAGEKNPMFGSTRTAGAFKPGLVPWNKGKKNLCPKT